MGIISTITGLGSSAINTVSSYVAPKVQVVTQPVTSAYTTYVQPTVNRVVQPVTTTVNRVVTTAPQVIQQPAVQTVLRTNPITASAALGISLAPKVIQAAPKVIQPVQTKIIQPVSTAALGGVNTIQKTIVAAPKVVIPTTKQIIGTTIKTNPVTTVAMLGTTLAPKVVQPVMSAKQILGVKSAQIVPNFFDAAGRQVYPKPVKIVPNTFDIFGKQIYPKNTTINPRTAVIAAPSLIGASLVSQFNPLKGMSEAFTGLTSKIIGTAPKKPSTVGGFGLSEAQLRSDAVNQSIITGLNIEKGWIESNRTLVKTQDQANQFNAWVADFNTRAKAAEGLTVSKPGGKIAGFGVLSDAYSRAQESSLAQSTKGWMNKIQKAQPPADYNPLSFGKPLGGSISGEFARENAQVLGILTGTWGKLTGKSQEDVLTGLVAFRTKGSAPAGVVQPQFAQSIDPTIKVSALPTASAPERFLRNLVTSPVFEPVTTEYSLLAGAYTGWGASKLLPALGARITGAAAASKAAGSTGLKAWGVQKLASGAALASKPVPIIGNVGWGVVGGLSGGMVGLQTYKQPKGTRADYLGTLMGTEILPGAWSFVEGYNPGTTVGLLSRGKNAVSARSLGNLYDRSRVMWHGTGEATGISPMERANLQSTGLLRQSNVLGRARNFAEGLTDVYARSMGKIVPGKTSIAPGGAKTYKMPVKMNYDYVTGKYKPAPDQTMGWLDRVFRVDYSLKPPTQTGVGRSVGDYVRPQFFDFSTQIPRSASVGKAWRNKIIASQQDLASGMSERIAPRTRDYYYKTSQSSVKLSKRLPVTEETVAGHEYIWARSRLRSKPENMPKDVLGELTKRVDFFKRHPIKSKLGTKHAVEANWPKVEAQIRANEAVGKLRNQQVNRLADQVLGKGETQTTGSKVYEYWAGPTRVRLVKQGKVTTGVGETLPTRVEKYTGRYLKNKPGRVTNRPQDVPLSLWRSAQAVDTGINIKVTGTGVEDAVLGRTLQGSAKLPRLSKGDIGVKSIGKDIQTGKVYEYWAGPSRVRLVKAPVRARPTGASSVKDDFGLDKLTYQLGNKRFYNYWAGANRVTLTKKIPGGEPVRQTQSSTRDAWELHRWLEGVTSKTKSHPLQWQRVEREVIPLEQDSAYWNRVSARLRYGSSATPEQVRARSVWGSRKEPVDYSKLIEYQAGPTRVTLHKGKTTPPSTPLSKTFGKASDMGITAPSGEGTALKLKTNGEYEASAAKTIKEANKWIRDAEYDRVLREIDMIKASRAVSGSETDLNVASTTAPRTAIQGIDLQGSTADIAYGIAQPAARRRTRPMVFEDELAGVGPLALGGAGVSGNVRESFDEMVGSRNRKYTGITLIPDVASGLGSIPRADLGLAPIVTSERETRKVPVFIPTLGGAAALAQVPSVMEMLGSRYEVGQVPTVSQVPVITNIPAITNIPDITTRIDQVPGITNRVDQLFRQDQTFLQDLTYVNPPPVIIDIPPYVPPTFEIPPPIIPPMNFPPLAPGGGGGGGGGGFGRSGYEFEETMALGDFLSDVFGGAGLDFDGLNTGSKKRRRR